MVNVLKFQTLFLFLFSNKMLLFKTGIHKMLVRIANREDPDQTASFQKQSDLGLHCLSRHFLQATNVQKFRIFTRKCSKIPNTFPFLFSNKLLVFWVGIHKSFSEWQTGKTLIILFFSEAV